MNDNVNNQNLPGQKPQEEKDFLAREEIKTMEKDTSKLREVEAGQERERIAKIKTEEELAREKERQEFAKKAAQERSLAEKAAQEREESLRKMREVREAKEKTLSQSRTENTEKVAGEFQGALRETQSKEEEVRKRFLARIEAQAENKESTPPVAPLPPVIEESFLKKPSSGQKLWIRIVLSLLAFAVLAVIATFSYWYFAVREKPQTQEPEITTPVPPAPEQKELVIPPSLFNIENSRTLKFSQAGEIPFLLSQALQSTTTLGEVYRLLFEDTKNNKIAGLKEFFNSFNVTVPDDFYGKLSNDATLFIYSQEEGNRLGLAIKVNDQEGLSNIMASWEGTMENDFKNLFGLWEENKQPLSSSFRDAKYQEISFRFQTYSRQDIGIVYAVFNNYLILTTSWKSMEKAIDKLKEPPLSIENMPLANKIGQLFFIGINGITLTKETEDLITEVRPGGILLLKKNIINEQQTKQLIQGLQQVAIKNYGVPLFIGVDQEGGEISPVNFIQEKTAQSEIKTPEQAYAIGLSRGEELKNLGVNLNLAPVLDAVQPGDFVFNRAFQETNSEPNIFVKALIDGQKTASILTAVKHFPGYGDISFDPEDKLATVNEAPQISLFKTAAEARPEFIMTSNVVYSEIDPDLPFSFSEKGINMLKENMGEDALIMTDDLPQQSLIDKFSLKGVVTLPIKAGADILIFSTNWKTTLREAVKIIDESIQNKEISQEKIDESVLKIIKLKKAYYSL